MRMQNGTATLKECSAISTNSNTVLLYEWVTTYLLIYSDEVKAYVLIPKKKRKTIQESS